MEFTDFPIWRRLPNGIYRRSRHDRYYCTNPRCQHSLAQHVYVHSAGWVCMAGLGCMCTPRLNADQIRLRETDLMESRDIEEGEDAFEPRE